MKVKRKRLPLLLLALGMLGSLLIKPSTPISTEAIAYPHTPGGSGFVNGVSWTGPSSKPTPTSWQHMEVLFGGSVDVSGADILAIQWRADKGSPGMTVGLISNGKRYMTTGNAVNDPNNETEVLFMDETGDRAPMGKVVWDSINITAGSRGIVLLDLHKMDWQGGNEGNVGSLENVQCLYITTSTEYNWDWKISIGSIGLMNWVNKGAPGEDLVYTSLFDVSEGKTISDYNNFSSHSTLDLITAYPFPQGRTAFNGGKTWTGPSQATLGFWEAIFININGTVDLSDKYAIAVQYRADINNPGMTWGVENSGTRFSTQIDGKPIYFQDEGDFDMYHVTDVLNAAVNIAQGKTGIAIIPISSLVWQFGDSGKDLSAVNNIVLTTNSLWNYQWQLSIGGIGYIEKNGDEYDFTPIPISSYYKPVDNCTMVDAIIPPIRVQSVSVSPTTKTLRVGDTHQPVATVLPVDANDKSIVWSTSSPGVAYVNPATGLVDANGVGTATVTVKTNDGNKTATITYTVLAAKQPSNDVVISEVYVNSGQSDSPYTHGFIELYNSSNETKNLSTWTIQYASDEGSAWTAISLSGAILSKGFYIVRLKSLDELGTDNVPYPDLKADAVTLGIDGFKLALVKSSTLLSGGDPVYESADVVDYLGAGTASSYEEAVAAAPTSELAIARKLNSIGYPLADTDDNGADFELAAPTPFNSALGVAHYILSEDNEGQCVAKYPIAKTMFLSLTQAQKEYFLFKLEDVESLEGFNLDYFEALDRFEAWAHYLQDSKPYEENEPLGQVPLINNVKTNDWKVTSIVLIALFISGCVAYWMFKKRRFQA